MSIPSVILFSFYYSSELQTTDDGSFDLQHFIFFVASQNISVCALGLIKMTHLYLFL